jgi:hypothetical protein
MLVMMPDELSLQLGELYMLSVECAHNMWRPVRIDGLKFIYNIDGFHICLLPDGCQT